MDGLFHSSMRMYKLAIVGEGVIGASTGLAIKERLPDVEVRLCF